jgi:anaerobic magnesium-protoporphyrin IX monomethyl ester cyclase
MKRILLMSCRSPFLDDSKIYPPLANLYLKSYVENHSRDIEVVLGDDDYNAVDYEFDAVGISIMTPQRHEADALARQIKQNHPGTLVIAGGPHVKHYLNDMLPNRDYDHLVPHDGELALLNIMLGGQPRVVSHQMSRQQIEAAPRPDRTSLNALNLLCKYSYELNGRVATTMMTARGCPMACTFCEDANTQIRSSGIANIEAQLDDIKRIGYEGVYIFDDLFAIAVPKVKPIADALKARDLIYRCNGQANIFARSEDLAKLLADTGCVEIAFGHESGSQRILDRVDKRTTVGQNCLSVEYAKKHGIHVKSFLMLGLPGEDAESVSDTEKFIRDSGIDDFQLSVYFPYKGTAIRAEIDSGVAQDIFMVSDGLGAYGQRGGSTEATVATPAFTAEQLLKIRDGLVTKYKPKSHEKKWGDKFFERAE